MLNAVGQAQHILLLGGTSEIGLAIVDELASRGGDPTVTLCARRSSPRIDDAIAEVQRAGAAHVRLIDFDALALERPAMVWDLPGGGRRLLQGARGYAATVVGGTVTHRGGQATGALPGKLVRSAAAAG